jgi:hypothetical protein
MPRSRRENPDQEILFKVDFMLERTFGKGQAGPGDVIDAVYYKVYFIIMSLVERNFGKGGD